MVKTASPDTTPTPTVRAPAFPAVRLDDLVALHKANLEALAEVQKVLADAVGSSWQRYLERVTQWRGRFEGSVKSFDKKQPEAYASDAQAALQTVFADAKAALETGVRTQQQVGQILSQRFVANLDQIKAFAA